LQNPASHSPLALAWGLELAKNLRTVLNGFRKIRLFLYKPLKRLTTFPIRPNPKLKLGENEKLMLQEALSDNVLIEG